MKAGSGNRIGRAVLSFAALLVLAASGSEPKRLSCYLLGGDGKVVSADDLRGKLTLINFFEENCPPCKEEAPFLNKLTTRHPDSLQVLAVGYKMKDIEDVRKVAAKWGMKYQVYVDTKDRLWRDFLVSACPHSLLFDEYGFLVMQIPGLLPAQIEQAVNAEVTRFKKKKWPPSIYCRPFVKNELQQGETAPDDLSLGITSQIVKGLKEKGLELLESEEKADVLLEGSVMKMEGIVGVHVRLSLVRNGGVIKEIDRHTESDDFSFLVDDIYKQIMSLP